MRKFNWQIFILIILALFTRFLFLNYPAEVVFDEVHVGKMISAYFGQPYHFDLHPPLTKVMIQGFANFWGYKDGSDFSNIGNAISPGDLFILRFLPAFLGSLLVILVYKIILALGFSKKTAFLGGFLIIFDNAFLVQSKFFLNDVFMIFFGFAALYCFILARKSDNYSKKRFLFYTISAIFSGFSISVKLVGLFFLGIILTLIFWEFLKNKDIKDFIKKALIYAVIVILIYLATFYVHFNLLKDSGPGGSFWGKFIELNATMFRSYSGIPLSHPDSSRWYQWLIMQKPIWYWTDQSDGKIANIYLVGNPLVWVPVVLSVIFGLFSLFYNRLRNKFSPLIYFLISVYIANLVAFKLVPCATFLYHYFTALAFGVLIFVLISEKIMKNNYIYFSFLFFVFIVFLAISPLSYGLPVSPEINHIYQNFINFLH